MLNSTDKFLVNDGSVTETVNWSDIQSEAFPMTVNVVITPDEPEVGEAVTATPVTVGGDAPYTYTYQWVTANNALGLNETEIAGATSNTYTPVSADTNKFLGCVVVSTDDAGNSSTGTGYATTAVELALVIAQPTVLTPADGAGIGGDISYFPKTSEVTGVTSLSAKFSTTLYTGTGSAGNVVDSGIEYTDTWLMWQKNRSQAGSHYLTDSTMVKTTTEYPSLSTNSQNAQATTAGPVNISGSTFEYVGSTNDSGQTSVVWSFKAAPGFFDIVTYQGNNTVDHTIPHALSANPGMIITKCVDDTLDWIVWHKDIQDSDTSGDYLKLNTTDAKSATNNSISQVTSTDFKVGGWGPVNRDGKNFVAYLFADTPGLIKCGEFTSNTGSGSDEIECGFKPGWVIYKSVTDRGSASGNNWFIYDTSRGNNSLYPNTSGTEDALYIQFTDTGFIHGVSSTATTKHIFVAIAESASDSSTLLELTNDKAYDASDNSEVTTIDKAFKAGDKVVAEGTVTFADTAAFSTTVYTGDGGSKLLETGIDNTEKSLIWFKNRSEASDHRLNDTVALAWSDGANGQFLSTNNTQIPAQSSAIQGYETNGVQVNGSAFVNGSGKSYVAWNFRGAPGFFDVVSFANTGDPIPHSLGTTPSFIITKNTSSTGPWYSGNKDLPNGWNQFVGLDRTWAASDIAGDGWQPTDTTFNMPDFDGYGADKLHVAYLFADTPGLIKCGKHTGIGQVDVGFKPGWVLMKNSQSTSNWRIFDNQRSIDSTDSYELQANTSDVEQQKSLAFNDTGFNQGLTSSEFIYIAIAENASAGQFLPTGVLTEDAAGTSMTLTDVTGEWVPGLTAVNETEATESAPGADDVVFTSSKPAITSGAVNSWGAAEWELSVDSGFVDKQESSVFLADSNPELGPTNFTLEDDTEYWVRTRYNSADPATVSEWSESTKFKTAGTPLPGSNGNFSTTLYTGNDTLDTPLETGVDNTGKALCWFKCREGRSHMLCDTNDNSVYLMSDLANAAQAFGSGRTIGFTSTGVVLNNTSQMNHNGAEFVAWNFAAAAGFFDIQTWDGDNSVGRQLPHNLEVVPGCVIVKSTSSSYEWAVYHKDLGNTEKLFLNETAAAATADYWNNTDPTNSDITFSSSGYVNGTGESYVGYFFADNPDGGIKCGSYTGTGTTNFIDCGFDAGWVLIKSSSLSNSHWNLFDSKRPSYLRPNTLDAENTNATLITFGSGGFTLNADNSDNNSSTGAEYIYVAIADTTVRFYDENTASTVTNHTLTKRYGVDPLEIDLKEYGIYPLTEQPTYAVAAYVRENGHYKPIRSYLPEVNRTNQAISDVQSSFEARIAALESGE